MECLLGKYPSFQRTNFYQVCERVSSTLGFQGISLKRLKTLMLIRKIQCCRTFRKVHRHEPVLEAQNGFLKTYLVIFLDKTMVIKNKQ